MKKYILSLLLILLTIGEMYSVEMPKPDYNNSLIFSFTHYFLEEEASEIDYVKSRFGNGLYARLSFSGFFGIDMDWNINPADSGSGIQEFKDEMDNAITFAKQYNVAIHLTLNFGMARIVTLYNDAKIEDIRNAQWYNDNNISDPSYARESSGSDLTGISSLDLNHVDAGSEFINAPEAGSSVIDGHVFTTLSRYARKLRAHLDAKVGAAFAYLKQLQDENPDVLIIVSAPGEAELNYYRINDSQYMQDFFCDYSPFAVLEFRDWIRHEGLYADGQKYAGEGYTNGGSRYAGGAGLVNFNADFGTSFNSWNLKYYHWDLTDPVDTNYTDGANPDTKIIPIALYIANGMMPTSGSDYTAGGFDPPRTMSVSGTDAFYDLWHIFRETLVYHYVKDIAKIARTSGFDKKKYYTHQVPGDYLFGTRPGDPLIPFLNPRYYMSTAPMWTANVYSDIGLGVTLYDVNFGSYYARTTLYGVGAADTMSDNWAALEYNPDVIPTGISAVLGDTTSLYNEMVRLYEGSPHIISFFKWKGDTDEYRFEGTNRETAAKAFFDEVKDVARGPLSTVFTPKQVENLLGSYDVTSGAVTLGWSPLIWTDLSYTWGDWGDFKEFVIYRGYSDSFTPDANSEIARQAETDFTDTGIPSGGYIYYKVAAVNRNGETGPVQTVSVDLSGSVTTPVLRVSSDRLTFSYIPEGTLPADQDFVISNIGIGTLNWTADENTAWFTCTPLSGTQGTIVTVSVDPTGLSEGTYSGNITISDPGASNSPQTVIVTLKIQGPSDPILSVSRDRLNFGYIIGKDAPPTQNIRISNKGTGAMNWTAVVDAGWLTGDPAAGEHGAEVTVSVDPTGLSIGTYVAIITVSAPDAEDSPQTVDVVLTVKAAAQDKPPFGEFATPIHDSTVSSSIPVTGWVLDDVGVVSVKIYRDPVTGESSKLVYIGDALFVEGARPDVESFYPDYPANYKAGWGYMMLTNFLPNNGNGTFKIYAKAADTSGNEVTLGTKTIICDNANAVKPFGAIDTPTQGGTASGTAFRNHGWALTPLPNMIPTDGSTIDVYIDSVNVGHPVYNINRSDIAAYFPTYLNSNGAGGYFDIDTTQYEEGIHTISWVAEDFAGNNDGIGSRYFTISNVGSERIGSTQTERNTAAPVDRTSPMGVIKGFRQNTEPEKILPTPEGVTVEIKELERIEIHLSETPSENWTGGLVVKDKLKPLPIGSTLDAKKGIFYWIPGAGFVGDYTLEFTGNSQQKRIKIRIKAKS
jgi:hypothetical protein